MLVEQVWTANAYRNFNYLIACAETGEAHGRRSARPREMPQARARDRGWEITQILNTHEHGDHTGGNRAMVAATGATLLAHANAKDTIPGCGPSGSPPATSSSIGADGRARGARHAGPHHEPCLPALAHRHALRSSAATRCSTPAPATAITAATPNELYDTFAGQLAKLPDATLIYPGPRLHREQPALYARPRARQRAKAKALLDRR